MPATQRALPGDTLKRITQEHRHIDEFVDWMKRWLEMDKKYVEHLEALRTSTNPEWSQSGVSPLVSPMLELVTREVEERQATCDTMNAYLTKLNNVNTPDRDDESGESMTSRYEGLIAACKAHNRSRNEASSTEAVKELKQWHEAGPNGTSGKWLWDMDDEDLRLFVLPEAERNYRESVVRQQALVRVVNAWHHSHLPELLHSHQSRSEEIKALVVRMTTEHSRFLTGLVGHVEATKDNVHAFSSSSFISWAHEQRDFESRHEYMKEAVHVNFWNGTTRSNVIFGAVSQTLLNVRLAFEVMESRDELYWLDGASPSKDKALEFEQSLRTQTSSQPQHLPNDVLALLCSVGLLSNPPLITLLDKDIKRYSKGISRKDIHIIMSRVTRQDELAVLLDCFPFYTICTMASLLTHREYSWSIVKDIYLKWDFSNNRPFPPGVKRERR